MCNKCSNLFHCSIHCTSNHAIKALNKGIYRAYEYIIRVIVFHCHSRRRGSMSTTFGLVTISDCAPYAAVDVRRPNFFGCRLSSVERSVTPRHICTVTASFLQSSEDLSLQTQFSLTILLCPRSDTRRYGHVNHCSYFLTYLLYVTMYMVILRCICLLYSCQVDELLTMCLDGHVSHSRPVLTDTPPVPNSRRPLPLIPAATGTLPLFYACEIRSRKILFHKSCG